MKDNIRILHLTTCNLVKDLFLFNGSASVMVLQLSFWHPMSYHVAMHLPHGIQTGNADSTVLHPSLVAMTGSIAREPFRLPCLEDSSHGGTRSSQIDSSRWGRPCSKGLRSGPADGTDSEWKECVLLRDRMSATESSSILGLKQTMTRKLC